MIALSVRSIALCFAWICTTFPVVGSDATAHQSNGDAGVVVVDSHDLVFMGESHPVLIRLHITIDGEPLRAAWNANVKRSFDYFDADENGAISAMEWKRAASGSASATTILQPSLFESICANLIPGVKAEQQRQPAEISFERFREKYRTDREDCQIRAQQYTNHLPLKLMPRVDANGDEKVSAEEFRQLKSSLHLLDIDGDESINLVELSQYQNPIFTANMAPRQQPARRSDEFVYLSSSASRMDTVSRILEKYSTPGQRAVSIGTLARTARDAHHYDKNKDSLLNKQELKSLVASATYDLEFKIHLGKRGKGEFAIERVATGAEHAGRNAMVNLTSRSSLIIVSGGALLDVQVNSGQAGGRLDLYKQQFKAADVDNNEYLEKKEVQQNYYLQKLFDRMDRDSDGKLFEDEMLQFLEYLEADARSRTVMSVVDAGRQLFEFLDADGDRRISPREQMRGLERSRRWDRDGDGHLHQSEMPTCFHLSFGLGDPTSNLGLGLVNSFTVFGQGPNLSRVESGPAWFVKLDRNRDGDVSSLEYPGPRDVFDKLDTNADGLVDAKEAAQ